MSRKVLCPGNSKMCKTMLPFGELNDHLATCRSVDKVANQIQFKFVFLKKAFLDKIEAKLTTDIFEINGETFAVQKKMKRSNLSFGVLMLAVREKCDRFKVTIEIQDGNCETAFSAQFNPAPIDLKNKDIAGLVVPKHMFAKMVTSDGDQIKYKLALKVSEKRARLQMN